MAQGRDLVRPPHRRILAAIVQTLERLRMLLALTVCDIRAVGPGRVERLEGPVAAHAVLGDRGRARRRALGDRPQVARRGGAGGAAALAARLVRPRIRRLCAAPLPRLLAEGGSGAPGRARQIALCDGGRGALAGDGSRDRRLPRRHGGDDRRARPPAPALDHRRRLRGAPAAISSTRRFSPRPTDSPSTRFPSRAPSIATKTNCGAPGASPLDRKGAARRNSRQRNHLRQERRDARRAAPSQFRPR